MASSSGAAAVVGAGVIGLTAALRLLQDGWEVEVLTADDPSETTSAVAAAIWYPYRAHPQERVLGWAGRSMAVLTALAGEPSAGVRLLPCRELLAAQHADPWWRDAVPAFARCDPMALPAGYGAAWDLTVPVVAMPAYLPWLVQQVTAAGGRIVRRRLSRLDEVTGGGRLVVHCAGLGARQLVADTTMTPIRGQVVVVEDPGLERAWLDQTDERRPTYIVPRGSDCVLGGTADVGVEAGAPDPAVAADILRRCVAIEPRLAGARVLGHRVGARPARPGVRLERAGGSEDPLIHAYGHGGAGVTLSWGCAEEIAVLARGVRWGRA